MSYNMQSISAAAKELGIKSEKSETLDKIAAKIRKHYMDEGVALEYQCPQCKSDIPDVPSCPFCGVPFNEEGEEVKEEEKEEIKPKNGNGKKVEPKEETEEPEEKEEEPEEKEEKPVVLKPEKPEGRKRKFLPDKKEKEEQEKYDLKKRDAKEKEEKKKGKRGRPSKAKVEKPVKPETKKEEKPEEKKKPEVKEKKVPTEETRGRKKGMFDPEVLKKELEKNSEVQVFEKSVYYTIYYKCRRIAQINRARSSYSISFDNKFKYEGKGALKIYGGKEKEKGHLVYLEGLYKTHDLADAVKFFNAYFKEVKKQ